MILTWTPRKEGESQNWFAWYPVFVAQRRGDRRHFMIWLQRIVRSWEMTDYGTYAGHYNLPPTARGEP